MVYERGETLQRGKESRADTASPSPRWYLSEQGRHPIGCGGRGVEAEGSGG